MATNTDIQKMYIAYFGRAADVSGLAYWTNQVTLANSSEAVINAFSASAEYADNYAGKSNEFIVNSLYNNLFGRDAEVDGLLYWTAKLNDGTFSVGNVAWAIMVGAQNEDVLALGNKATAAQAFTDAMDTTDEIIGYSGADAAAEAKAWLATVTDDSATLTAALATVDTAVADAVAASDVNAGQTFMLTTNVDTITGTAGNDIIIGEDLQLNGANIQSFGALDSIDGGAGADTLKILDQNNAINVAGSNVSNVETVIIQGAAAVTANTTNWTGVETLNVTQSGGAVAATAAATTDINVSGAVLGAGTLATTNGKDVSVTHAGVNGTAEGAISVNGAAGAVSVTTTNSLAEDGGIALGTATANAGTVTVQASGNGNVVAGVAAGGTLDTIAVTGGTTITVNQDVTAINNIATAAVGANIVTQGAVSVTGTSATTSVTVTQDDQVAAVAAGAATTGVNQTQIVTFSALTAGQTAVVNGLTFTAAKNLTAEEVAAAFSNLTDTTTFDDLQSANGPTANGIYTGSNTTLDYSSGDAVGATVTYTATTQAGNTAALTVGGTGTNPTVAAGVTGVAAVAAITGRAGVANGAVTIADGGNASITDITVDGYAASTINANALTNLTLKNSGATGTMAVTTTSTGAMTLNLDDVDAAVNLDAGGASITNLTVNTSGTASTGAIAAAAATTVTINAEAALSGASAYTAATLIDVNGSAAVNLTGAIANATTLQTIDASGNTGGVTVVLGATNDVKFTGGTGNDALTIAIDGVLVGDDVDMGAGNDTLTMLALTAAANIATTTALQGGEGTDTLALTIASADNVALSASTAFNAKIDGFEKVSLTHSAAGAETVDLANIDGISYVISANSTAAAAGLSNMANNGTLELTTAGVGMDVFMADSTSTTADVFNIVLDDSLTAAGVAAGIVAVSAAAAAVNQNGVETINISVDDTFVDVTGALDEFGAAIGDGVDDTNAVFSLTVTDSATTTSSYSTVNVTGAGDLTLTTATNVATSNLTTVDASTMTGILTYTTTAANMTVTGGSAADVITANTNGVTINGGAGNDTLVVADNMDLVKLNGGAGTDTFDINGASSNKSNYAVIQDAASGDIINLAGVDGNAGATTNLTAFNATQITLAQGATESTQAYLDQAMTTLANGAVGWFQYNGNTFVTADVGGDSANSFVDGTDFVIMLTGTYDLSTASFNATSDTLELA